ncbi:MAG: hypothetical protein C0434_08420 [Xanthomonadaceae bacterium]|nr:hypothetical protein [Xanthomonadaceae bacterium]
MSASLIRTVHVGSKAIEIHTFSGEVLESQKWTTTQISGGGGGGYSHNGTGFSSSAPVTSRTTTHDQIFVRAPSGEERALELSDVHLAVRKGQWLTLVLAIKAGKQQGPYVAVYNHNTGALDWVAKAVNDSCGPMLYNLLIVIGVFAGVGGTFALLGGEFLSGLFFGGLGIGGILWIVRRRKAFKAEISGLAAQFKAQHGPAQA